MTNGVVKYVRATAEVFFEPEHVACQFCPFLEKYSRDQCRRTGEYIIDTRFTVGHYCPLKFDDEVKE